MEYKDYYKTLGVAKGASAKEIKAALKKPEYQEVVFMNLERWG